ncbi:jg2292 [Pararge aegeria aegeria]|uniref:Jg2292 protein n=1 Tax=Pararge aegeria aegeria TaxID=348720 RepID=A0A8S4QKK1_9NEOP|nr:jg2292 [Pararge aegeria aegeria]
MGEASSMRYPWTPMPMGTRSQCFVAEQCWYTPDYEDINTIALSRSETLDTCGIKNVWKWNDGDLQFLTPGNRIQDLVIRR